jgi:hypothetical protein
MSGQYVYKGTDENDKLLLQHLQQPSEIAEMDHIATVSEEKFRGKLKAWQESTATSPSGMHLGHYKAQIAKHQYSVTPEDKDEDHKTKREVIDRMQTALLHVHLSLLNYE